MAGSKHPWQLRTLVAGFCLTMAALVQAQFEGPALDAGPWHYDTFEQDGLQVSVMARGLDGQCKVFPVASNVHDHGILAVSTVDIQPTPFAQRATQAALAGSARAMGRIMVRWVQCMFSISLRSVW